MRQGYEWKSSERLKTKLIGKILGILRLLFMFIRFLCSLLPLIELPRTYIFRSRAKHIVCVANVHSCSALNYHTEASAICCFEKCHQVVPKASIVEMGRSSFSVLVTQSELYAECRAMLSPQTSFA